MATGDLLFLTGTARTWQASSGDETMSLNTLAATVGRAGAEHDWSATSLWPTHLFLSYEVTMASAPAAGEFVELYYLASYVTAKYAGNFTASDEAFTDAELRQQCLHIGNMILDASTALQRFNKLIANPGPLGKPAVFNGSAQTFSASANTSKVIITPLTLQTQ